MRPLPSVLVILLSTLCACPPSLGPADDDSVSDDDSVADDDSLMDDDTTWGDDDTPWGDDDVVDACEFDGSGYFALSSTLGEDPVGTWYDAATFSSDIEGLTLDIVLPDGNVHQVRTDLWGAFSGLLGAGSFFWYAPGATMAGDDAFFAASTDDGTFRVVLASQALWPETLDLAGASYRLEMNPNCAEWAMEDSCGLWHGQPFDLWSIDGDMIAITTIWPGDSGNSIWGDWVTVFYGRAYTEMWCDDVPDVGYSVAIVTPWAIPAGGE